MKKILLYSLAIAFCLLANRVEAQVRKESKESKTFGISRSGQLLVKNKYGFVKCNVWDKDSIRVNTEVIVNTKKHEDTEGLMNSIWTEYNAFVDILEVETIFGDNRKSFIKNYLAKVDPFNNNKVDVNYEIWVPASINLEIENRFGDVYLEEMNSDVDIIINYGDLRTEDLYGRVNFDLSFGRLVGTNLKTAKMDLKNYDVRLRNVEELNLKSSGSEMNFDSVSIARIDLNRDEIQIKKVEKIKGKAAVSDIDLFLIEKDVELTLRNCSFIVDKFSSNIERVDINEESSQIDLNVRNLNIDLKAELEDAQLSVPKTVQNVSKDVINEKKAHRRVSLDYGGSSDRTKFVLHGVKGKFTLTD